MNERRQCLFVFGPESSATRLWTQFAIEAGFEGDSGHEQRMDNWILDAERVVWRRSFPHRGEWPNVIDLFAAVEGKGFESKVLVTMREVEAMAQSQVVAGHSANLRHAYGKIKRAWRELGKVVQMRDFCVVSYESLILHPERTVLDVFAMLGFNVAVDVFDFDKLFDANQKYY